MVISQTLIGQETLGAFLRLYHERHTSEQNLFRFGNGQEELSERVVSMPVVIHGRRGRIDAAVIKGDAPLLLSRDFEEPQSSPRLLEGHHCNAGRPHPLQLNEASQLILIISWTPKKPSWWSRKRCFLQIMTNGRLDPLGCVQCGSNVVSWLNNGLGTEQKAHAWRQSCFHHHGSVTMLQKGERKGLSYDIKQGWDLLKTSIQRQVDLPMLEQLQNERIAQRQADFCVQQIKKQIKRGGRVLVEHPWASDQWKYPPMAKLLKSNQLVVHRANMCAYELKDPDNGQPILKTTGLAVSHPDMASLALQCPGPEHHKTHQIIAGHTHDGTCRSAVCAA